MASRWERGGSSLIDNPFQSLLEVVVVDTDVLSFVFKRDTRATLYQRHRAGKELVISFVTLGELPLGD